MVSSDRLNIFVFLVSTGPGVRADLVVEAIDTHTSGGSDAPFCEGDAPTSGGGDTPNWTCSIVLLWTDLSREGALRYMADGRGFPCIISAIDGLYKSPAVLMVNAHESNLALPSIEALYAVDRVLAIRDDSPMLNDARLYAPVLYREEIVSKLLTRILWCRVAATGRCRGGNSEVSVSCPVLIEAHDPLCWSQSRVDVAVAEQLYLVSSAEKRFQARLLW